eukprot:CAMPEP_0179038998 /NCGR_PEP_ID=MMETSP0796-20121207/14921_1 /TAXON_ID=73915 /ORGANISM="Pyrodinium bahamense, Strain pbaha01" /LENGTH=464 /DNA_ID=CAMNT_0020735331 /DNA_START=149 /DNA_END=1543 /DNA_ORIENTATION=+
MAGLSLALFAVLAWAAPGSRTVHPAVVHRSLQDASSYPGYDEYSWMWGDAGSSLFGHNLAEVDLLRWSEWKNSAATIRDLEAFQNAHGKPVEMIGMNGHGRQSQLRPTLADVTKRQKMYFATMDQAISYLNMHRASYSWMWGDAGAHFLGHRIAEIDPLRWSSWERLDSVIKDLESQRTEQNLQRPVEIRKDGQSKVTFISLDQALRYLRGQIASTPRPRQGAASSPAPVQQAPAVLRQSPTPAAKASSLAPSASAPVDHVRSTATWRLSGPTFQLLMALVATALLACCGCLGCCLLGGGGSRAAKSSKASKRKRCKGPEASGDSSSDEPLCDAALEDTEAGCRQGCGQREAQPRRDAFREDELRRLLLQVEEEEPERALPALQGQALPLDPARRAEAVQEVERVLAARDLQTLFGDGSSTQRRSEFRRLVRMLHPDKGLVSGERATLALRRVVEYHATLTVGE